MGKLDIQRDVALAPLTTFGLGGAATYFARVRSDRAVRDALRWAAERGLRAAVLGGGSNLIVPDEGYDGLVIQMAISELDFESGIVDVGAGVPWERVVEGAVARSWAGLECLTGIPGSTGATPIQNVGAYGQEVAEVLESVRALRRDTLRIEELSPEQCELSYRDSLFKREPDRFVVCGVRFRLRPDGPGTVRYAELQEHVGPRATLSQIRTAVLALRRRKSMVIDPDDPNHRSAGSFFLNPVVKAAEADRIVAEAVTENLVASPEEVPRYAAGEGMVKLAAGWLIEQTGVAKGTRRGSVGVSTKHALALVHHGGGTTAELLSLAEEIRARVRDRFGVELEREPRLLA